MKPFDANGAFAPTVPKSGATFRRLAVRGAGMTVFSGGFGLAIQVVATVVLARSNFAPSTIAAWYWRVSSLRGTSVWLRW